MSSRTQTDAERRQLEADRNSARPHFYILACGCVCETPFVLLGRVYCPNKDDRGKTHGFQIAREQA